jgi:SAM-dependent methyltransferase
MMPRNRELTLLCTRRLASAVTQACPRLRLREVRANVMVFVGAVDLPALRESEVSVTRLLDYYYLVYDARDQTTLRVPELVLFDLLAEHYEMTIDIRNNLKNIRELLTIVVAGLKTPIILDYGCGTGLSRIVAREFGASIVGYDRSEPMRFVARSHGLEVLDELGLQTLPDRSLDGLIASYVLHLAAAQDDLPLAAMKLHKDAKIAANFHKGLGLEEASRVLASVGFSLEASSTTSDGRLIASWKRGNL